MNNNSTINEVLNQITLSKRFLRLKLNSSYYSDPKASLKLFYETQSKYTELKIVQTYLENLIKE